MHFVKHSLNKHARVSTLMLTRNWKNTEHSRNPWICKPYRLLRNVRFPTVQETCIYRGTRDATRRSVIDRCLFERLVHTLCTSMYTCGRYDAPYVTQHSFAEVYGLWDTIGKYKIIWNIWFLLRPTYQIVGGVCASALCQYLGSFSLGALAWEPLLISALAWEILLGRFKLPRFPTSQISASNFQTCKLSNCHTFNTSNFHSWNNIQSWSLATMAHIESLQAWRFESLRVRAFERLKVWNVDTLNDWNFGSLGVW